MLSTHKHKHKRVSFFVHLFQSCLQQFRRTDLSSSLLVQFRFLQRLFFVKRDRSLSLDSFSATSYQDYWIQG